MGTGYLSKRRAISRDDPDNILERGPDILGAVSKPCYLLPRKRKRFPSVPLRTKSEKKRAALERVWRKFEQDVVICLRRLRDRDVRKIVGALECRSQDKNDEEDIKEEGMLAVMLLMGAAGVGGDRSEIFEHFLQSVVKERGSKGVKTKTTILLANKCRTLVAALHAVFGSEEKEKDIGEMKDIHLFVGLEDAELFDGDVLRDLVYVCNSRVELGHFRDISLVFGLAAQPDPVHSALGVREASMIAPVIVYMPTPEEVFEELVRSVFAPCQHPLLLSQRAFAVLRKEFYKCDSSSSFVLRFMRHAYALQFWAQPLMYRFHEDNIVYMREEEDKVDEGSNIKNAFTSVPLEDVRLLSSMRSQSRSLRDECRLRDFVAASWKAMKEWRQDVKIAQWILSGVSRACGLHTSSFESEVFLEACNKDVRLVDSEPAGALFSKLRTAYRQELEHVLYELTRILATEDKLRQFCREVSHLREEMDALTVVADVGLSQKEETGKRKQVFAKGGGAAKRRRTALLQENLERNKKMDPLQPIRDALAAVLRGVLETAKPLAEVPMHEVFYFEPDRLQHIQLADGGMGSGAQPRAAFCKAMRNSQFYLGVSSPTPDVATAYNLLAEGGRLVNVYDWYQSFSAVRTLLNQEQDSTEGECETQARFAKACAELEFVGAFKKTNRKTDHVTRLLYE